MFIANPCGELNITRGSSNITGEVLVNTDVMVTCDVGYGIDINSNTLTVACESNSIWSQNNIICYRKSSTAATENV